MFVVAASSSKKQLYPSTPHNSGVGKRMDVSSTKTRAASSQRGRGRRGRPTKQLQTPLSGRSTDSATSTTGRSVASLFNGQFTLLLYVRGL